ncbi:RNA 2',3'-cyclic phosphodiesterase [Sporosarcina sp. GW1-11]|uniref:RNA 2',3'-cyclic phosphodiesterase n=1 Tax=Sporosarcina sp. GW1-11 TaxID=2899126 RepID=UPI00294EF4C1|nr:RNA 2',3'-cyclic phosphodiesterase [Sporosarcina sp. GW1-11]MDV6378005.1 RNA 2',3'-cyclic phosphodiesterase [Sporosarcina sp. GW1-11]
MAQHYFIGISIAHNVVDIAEHFRMKYQLKEKYKVIPHAHDLHLTLRYIGELNEDEKNSLEYTLRKIAQDHNCFTTSVTGLSFFGSPTGPRVIYLSVDPVAALCNLQRHVARRTEKTLGLERENRFVPHITIAKKRKVLDKMQLAREEISPVPLAIEGFTLFAIHPEISPSYTSVTYFPLKKS